MFLLDTSVLSAMMAAEPAPEVAAWVSGQPAGRPTATVDLMIASVARCQRASVVTRNVADFDACGVAVVNPWGG